MRPPSQGELRVPIVRANDVVTARQMGRELAERLGFSRTDLTLIVTAIYEIARNIIEHADKGEIVLRLVSRDGVGGIEVIATDSGPGIADVGAALGDGYGTGESLGLGLPGARRLMSDFHVASQPNSGTVVTMRKWRAA